MFVFLSFVAITAGSLHSGFAAVQWEPMVRMGELFPSYIISTATMKKTKELPANYFGDWNGQVGAEISSTDPNTLVQIMVSSTKLIKPSKLNARLIEPNKTYSVYPTLEYDYDALYAAREPFPETITVRVAIFKDSSDKKPLVYSKKQVVQVRSINDCPRRIKGKNGQTDMSWMFGAYVNENHPVVEEILQEALKTGIVSSFLGYQRDEATVGLQAFAIWDVLQKRGIKYSSIKTPSAYSDNTVSQHVRRIGDSINYQQANCVDGSVLFASVFRKIGLETCLVLVPGHCFVGVWLDQKRTTPLYLESTKLGHAVTNQLSFSTNSVLAPLNQVKEKSPVSFNTFVSAERSGLKKYHQYSTNTTGKVELRRIDISEWRKRGVQPLKDDYRGQVSQPKP